MTDAENSTRKFRIGKGLVVGAGVAITGLASVVLLLVGIRRKKDAERIPSPAGRYTLSTGVNYDKAEPTRYLCVTVTIRDADGQPLHHEITPCPHLHRWSIAWVSDDEIELNSVDVGRYVLKRETGNLWIGKLAPTKTADAE